ncbi:MAG: DinB family protein, partial [Gemmatimonadota bacterium]|nr:DinB family protein [Gemmatimonadota bacterium]
MEIREIGPFLDYLESIRGRTRRVVSCIPAEKMERSHQPNRWTLGDLVRHLGAIERWMFTENAV